MHPNWQWNNTGRSSWVWRICSGAFNAVNTNLECVVTCIDSECRYSTKYWTIKSFECIRGNFEPGNFDLADWALLCLYCRYGCISWFNTVVFCLVGMVIELVLFILIYVNDIPELRTRTDAWPLASMFTFFTMVLFVEQERKPQHVTVHVEEHTH